MEEEIITNQTQFAHEKPLMSPVEYPTGSTAPVEEPALKKKSKLPFIIGGMGLLLVALLLLVVMRMPRGTVQVAPTPTPSPNTQLAADHPLKIRLTSLINELDAADPSQSSLVFPPVDMALTLDQVKR
jgi:hypothetical protein